MSSLLNSLQSLANSGNEEVKEASATSAVTKPALSTPFAIVDDNEDNDLSDAFFITKKKEKKQNKDMSEIFSKIDRMKVSSDDELDLDDSLDILFNIDQDEALANNLIMQGRKYARDHGTSIEAGEIEKAFIPQEKALKELIGDIDADSKGVQRDIDSLRMARTRNTKSLADLVQAKGSLVSTKLSAIKELNSMKKAIIDINLKAKEKEKEADGDENQAAFAVQRLLNANASSSNSNENGITLASISGAIRDDSELTDEETVKKTLVYDDATIQHELGLDEETEGDKYIKYEDMDVKMHLQVRPDGSKNVIAVDKNGDIVPDYPMPSNVDELQFNISEDLGIANDNLNREYILDKV